MEEYQSEKERNKNLNISPPLKPRLKRPEFIHKWFNMSNYAIDQWAYTYDEKFQCDMIIADMTHLPTSTIEVVNLQYSKAEWMTILSTIKYIFLQLNDESDPKPTK